MGLSSSKTIRKLPKRPSWAGTRTQGPGPIPSETKNEAIEKDYMDPQFLSNLNRLGPVRVDHHMQTNRPENHVLGSRAHSDTSTRNHLVASTLSALLDERKLITSREEIESLARRYKIDVATLDRVSRFVTSPSIKDGTIVRRVGKDGEDEVTMTAGWIEPLDTVELQDNK